MDKLLKIEVTVLLLLVMASIFVRVGVINGAAESVPEDKLQNAEQTQPPETVLPEPTETEPTEPAPTEVPIKLTFSEDFSLESREYFVYDCAEENLMACSDTLDEKIWPASITKLFTAYVALQYLQEDAVIKLGREVYMVDSNSSLAYLKKDQSISVSLLVEGMLLPSGNDAAYALAVAAARAESGDSSMSIDDALAHFVELMNRNAQDNGMTGSHFANPDGIHDFDHYTTCGDLITIAKLALSNELIRSCTALAEDSVPFSNGDVAQWSNTNALIDPESQYYHEDAIGLKTGHTGYAGFCVLTAFELDGEYIIIGTFGCQRPEDRFIDALKLYDLVVGAKAA